MTSALFIHVAYLNYFWISSVFLSSQLCGEDIHLHNNVLLWLERCSVDGTAINQRLAA